jgi:uncharacterized membrane protein AbrB (regulator of aidB expression)
MTAIPRLLLRLWLLLLFELEGEFISRLLSMPANEGCIGVHPGGIALFLG